MKMSDNPTKYEVLIEQYLRSILDISGSPTLQPLNYRGLSELSHDRLLTITSPSFTVIFISIKFFLLFPSLYAVSLDTAVPKETRFGKAKKIEDCACPPEYSGTSCQVSLKVHLGATPGGSKLFSVLAFIPLVS